MRLWKYDLQALLEILAHFTRYYKCAGPVGPKDLAAGEILVVAGTARLRSQAARPCVASDPSYMPGGACRPDLDPVLTLCILLSCGMHIFKTLFRYCSDLPVTISLLVLLKSLAKPIALVSTQRERQLSRQRLCPCPHCNRPRPCPTPEATYCNRCEPGSLR